MTASTPALDTLRANPNWASLPLFDRKGWSRVRFGDVVENVNEPVGYKAPCASEQLSPCYDRQRLPVEMRCVFPLRSPS